MQLAWWDKSVYVNTITDLLLAGTLAAVWLAAGLVADAVPGAATARALRRRVRALSILIGTGVAAFLLVPVVTTLVPGDSNAPAAALLSGVPAMIVLAVTARRVARIRRGTSAFDTAPLTPAPHALRAAAAHPWVATPLQVTGLAAVVGVPVAAGIVEVPAAGVASGAVAVMAVLVLALSVRHGLRHSRLNTAVLAPLGGRRLRAPALAAREGYTAVPALYAEPAVSTPATPEKPATLASRADAGAVDLVA